jgi:RNA polymerase sigma factor (sigma-70 family)
VGSAAIPAPAHFRPLLSKRLLTLASDDVLVEHIRRGSEAAFSVAFERYAAGLLGFCRHMVGSPEEAEDAVQHTFAAAFFDLARPEEREVALKPWLYAIARNRCLSILRSRCEQAALDFDLPTEGLAEEVERRADLRDLLRDLRELPDEQRAALLLAEAGDLSHAEIAHVLGCGVANVKQLVFRARSGLIQRREAREAPCADVREQLANLRGNSLRRSGLRHHLRSCPGCRAYHEQISRQRRMLRAAVPVVPSLALRSGLRTAAGLGGGSAGGGLAAGIGTGFSASLGTGMLVKIAAVGVLAGGGVVSGIALVEEADDLFEPSRQAPVPAGTPSGASSSAAAGLERSGESGVPGSALPVVDLGAGFRRQERRPEAGSPIPGRPGGDPSPVQDQNADRLALSDEARPSEPVRIHEGPAAGAEEESEGDAPVAAPRAGAPANGGPPTDAPTRGGPPTDAPTKDGPPTDAQSRGGPPADAPTRGGPPRDAPTGGGPPADAPVKDGRPGGTPAEPVSPQSAPAEHAAPEDLPGPREPAAQGPGSDARHSGTAPQSTPPAAPEPPRRQPPRSGPP